MSKIPTVVRAYMRQHEETETEVRDYIKRQLVFFKELERVSTNEAGWIALKLGCSIRSADAAIKWATT